MDYFLLIDCNNFFVSCERVFRPDLRGKPVVVLSSNDGCVIARSNESKALGIGMGVPFFKVKNIIKQHKIAVFSSNIKLYQDFSRRVMRQLRSFAPAIEVYSIDEAFIEMRGMSDDFDIVSFAQNIVYVVTKGCGIPISIGIAPTKTLSKLATKLVKKSQMGSNNICKICDKEQIEQALKLTKIDDVWGIGRQSVIKLRRNNIESAYDFTKLSPLWVERNLTIRGSRILQELKGEIAIDLEREEDEQSQQSIMVSRSFTKEIDDFDELSTAVANFTTSAVSRMRAQEMATHQIMVFCKTNRFAKSDDYYNDSTIHYFESASNNLIELVSIATALLKQIFRKGSHYKKAGVVLSKFTPSSKLSSSLFDDGNIEKTKRLMGAIDKINSNFGDNSIVSARRGFGSLSVSGHNISPCYTTRWSDLLEVK